MFSKRTVMIIGAGASMPYGFPSGEGLLREARQITAINDLANFLPPDVRILVPSLHEALRGTLERSIDAMLETRDDISRAGKALIAKKLLIAESRMRSAPHLGNCRWYEQVWGACNLSSLEAFSKTPLTVITYNYDRSFEYSFIRSLQTRFRASEIDCARALSSIGPIHLHGMLGFLPSLGTDPSMSVPFGSSSLDGVTDGDCLTAATCIQIVHEPNPQLEAFVRARDAISDAERVVFIGFSYGKTNVERLLLETCMKTNTQVYLCAMGFRHEEQYANIRPLFAPWEPNLFFGTEQENIAEFFRHYPQTLK